MGIVISVGVQKGGAGKTTTTAITTYLLAEMGYNVLVIDFDAQGNTSRILSKKSLSTFTNRTVMNAIIEKDLNKFIYNLNETDNINEKFGRYDLLPADDSLASLSEEAEKRKINVAYSLKEIVTSIKSNYDFIFIDQPPHLGAHTVAALIASDYSIVMLQSEPLCYFAIPRYLELLEQIKERLNKNLKLAGILATMLDARTSIDKQIIEQTRLQYEDWVFNTVIKRKNRIKEFSLNGVQHRTKEDKEALLPYVEFVEELIQRVKQ
ncbi:ParA family protein [Paenibacillus sp. CFBP13512]|uniref:ParA family protein n=1 Tax=Paenibacillus sp. CFBP13512 TaxID=2184007 RepID=UPI001375E734|nr:ParA family protein [Paenibacillus sp. CFBP13512]